VRAGYFFTIRVVFLAVLGIGVFTCAFAPQLIGFFRDDPDVVAIGTLTLRLVSFTLPFVGIAMITNFMLQTSRRMWRALFLGVCRLGLVLGPVVVVTSRLFGLFGVQIAQPVTDVITFLITIPLATSVLRDFRRLELEQEQAQGQGQAAV
jgi:Na+-driven multidrug efflux pump